MSNKKQKWEYKSWTIELANVANLDYQLNLFGNDGWELVSVGNYYKKNQELIFKRPIIPQPETDDKH